MTYLLCYWVSIALRIGRMTKLEFEVLGIQNGIIVKWKMITSYILWWLSIRLKSNRKESHKIYPDISRVVSSRRFPSSDVVQGFECSKSSPRIRHLTMDHLFVIWGLWTTLYLNREVTEIKFELARMTCRVSAKRMDETWLIGQGSWIVMIISVAMLFETGGPFSKRLESAWLASIEFKLVRSN